MLSLHHHPLVFKTAQIHLRLKLILNLNLHPSIVPIFFHLPFLLSIPSNSIALPALPLALLLEFSYPVLKPPPKPNSIRSHLARPLPLSHCTRLSIRRSNTPPLIQNRRSIHLPQLQAPQNPLPSPTHFHSWWRSPPHPLISPTSSPSSTRPAPPRTSPTSRTDALATYLALLRSSPSNESAVAALLTQIFADRGPAEDRADACEAQRAVLEAHLGHALDTLPQLAGPARTEHVIGGLLFLVNGPHTPRIVAVLGLDPLLGWRNAVREPLRLRTLRLLLRLANALGPDIAHTFHAAHGRAADDQQRLLARLGLLLLLALAKQGSVWQALRLFWTLDRLDSPADDPQTSPARRAATALALVDALLARNKLDAAEAVLDRLALQDWLGPVYRRYLLSLLHVKGARGDVGAVERVGALYARIGRSDDALGPATGRNKRARGLHLHDARMPVARARIEALGVRGETAAASAVFRDTLGAVAPRLGVPGQLPDLYAEMMRVHLKADDPVAIEGLLAEMASRSDPHGLCRPDERHFNILLQAYANRTDTDGCTAVLDRMARADVRPDAYTYGNICLLFCHRAEPEAVLAVIETLTKSVSPWPTRELWNMLLDAYVETGDWTRAGLLLEFLERDDTRRGDMDVVTNGTVLKALVLAGCPTHEVLATFKAMYDTKTGLAPDARAYTLLLLSVCDAGLVELAEAIFQSLKEETSQVAPNVYMYGTLISGLLRQRRREQAMGYLDEMRAAGIDASLVIYSMLTTAYAASSSAATGELEEDEEERQMDGVVVARQMAARFRRDLLASEARLRGRTDAPERPGAPRPGWGERGVVRRSLSQRLLGPIIQSYVKSARPAKALEVFRELVASLGSELSTITGGKPADLDIYTMLLDGYRRAQDPVGVMEIWREIFRLATSDGDAEVKAGSRLLSKVLSMAGCSSAQATLIPTRRKPNRLCLPLSIYTECLSRHGYHSEVAEAWESVQTNGFAFDEGNWNELCVAVFRSGSHRMGWRIVEQVFCGRAEAGTGLEMRGGEEEEDHKGWVARLREASGGQEEPVEGLEGTRLSGARRTAGPMRPPNRTSVRRAVRFDNATATRVAVEELIGGLRQGETARWGVGGEAVGWGAQVERTQRARRAVGWRPSAKVLRMLHGSMWRECSDIVVGQWERMAGRDGTVGMDEAEAHISEPVRRIVEGYAEMYPVTMVEVLMIDEPRGEVGSEAVGLGQGQRMGLRGRGVEEEMVKWAKEDFVVRVVRRTIERIREY